MNAKYALALILALQVSMSLCDVPQPSAELLDKYNAMEQTFMRRLVNAYNKIRTAVAPMVEQVSQNEQVKEYREGLEGTPGHQTFVNVLKQVAAESAKVAQTVQKSTLGLYEHYLRPDVGTYLDETINKIKVYLDMYLPADPAPAAA